MVSLRIDSILCDIQHGLPPENFAAGPTDDPGDDNIAADPDEDLPWPIAAKVQEWWAKHGGALSSGQRYLSGGEISTDNCQRVLATGFQRQRAAAALEWALSAPEAPYVNTHAPGFRQSA